MDKSGADAYIFAKTSGNLGKSYTGSRSHILFEQKSLAELWTLLFKNPAPAVPEVLLAEQIEKEAFDRFFAQYVKFVNLYDHPDAIFTDLLCTYEAENLKLVAAALANGEKKCPPLQNLGSFAKCDYSKWPDLTAITADSDFAWFNATPEISQLKDVDFKMDIQVVQHLYKSIKKQRGENKAALLKLFDAEYIIKNIVWALRLRIYYKMEKEEILPKLIYVSDSPTLKDPIAGSAIKVLDMPLDEFEVWEKWQYNEYVNPHVAGDVWQIDPGWIENRGKAKLNQLALNVFHQNPMSVSSLLGWYKIKEYELNCICTAVESLRLNISAQEAMSAVGIVSDGGVNG